MTASLELPQLDHITELLERALSHSATAAWYTLEQAYCAKFGDPDHGPSLDTIKKNLSLQPRGGTPDGWQHSKKAWTRETVDRWLAVDDSTLPAYLAEYAPGLRPPAFIEKALARRPAQEVR